LKSRVVQASAAVAASLSLLTLAGCGGDADTSSAAAADAKPEIRAEDFNAKRFDRSSNVVDNAWFPLKPGMQLVFDGTTLEEGERVKHRVIWTISDLVKVIGGVRTAVVWERDFRTGELIEAELALFAQDKDGYVWHLGQYPEEYEEGKFVAAPAWFHGIKGAKAGITMMAEPRLGTPAYKQGFAPPPVSWVDRGQVYKLGQQTCVPAGCYKALVIREFEPDKPGASQLKYYARGIGNVRVGWMGKKDVDKEVLMLTQIKRLDAAGRANVRNAVLTLERHAYKVSKNVYGKTAPMTR
jgi:hypothetical protein